MRTRGPRLAFVVAVGLLYAACFGGGDGASGPLQHRFDDMYIAAIPLDERQDQIRTQNDWSVAKFEKAKAEADYNDASTQLELAKNELKAAKLKEDSAKLEKKDAEKSADQNKINTANRQFRAAEKFRKAGEVRVKYLEAYREYLKKQVRYTTENMYWREAQFELAKAKIASGKNIKPKGFVFEQYSNQEANRSKKASDAREKVDNEKQKALSQRNKWLEAQNEADTMIGTKTQLPDPMAPRPEQGTDLQRGAGGVTVGGGGVTPGSTSTTSGDTTPAGGSDGTGNNGGGAGPESSPQ